MTRRDLTNGVAVMVAGVAPVTVWAHGSYWRALVGMVVAPALGFIGAYVSVAPSRPLWLPWIAALDLRPRWERHPYADENVLDFRGEPDAVPPGGDELGVAVTPPRCAYDFTHPRGMTEDEARRQMGLPPVS